MGWKEGQNVAAVEVLLTPHLFRPCWGGGEDGSWGGGDTRIAACADLSMGDHAWLIDDYVHQPRLQAAAM